jgi:15-cis-phytoene desaturase
MVFFHAAGEANVQHIDHRDKRMATKKVIILGGGVAGLTVAHELIERGFNVEVYEKSGECGGKAQSSTKLGSGTCGRKDFPGEHGFRFFPGFYQHIPDTMRRIPYSTNANGVFDNLLCASQTAIAQEMRPLYTFLTHRPTTLDDWLFVMQDWFGRTELNLQPGEAAFFIYRMLDMMSMCTERRFAYLEFEPWWVYIDAANRSLQYRKLLAQGLTRSLIAMQAEEGCTRTIGSILIQMLMSLTSQSGTMDRVLNGPTSDVWIAPWVRYLESKGVQFRTNATLQSFDFNGTSIAGVTLMLGGTTIKAQGDYYVAAFPLEIANLLFTPAMKAAAPSISNLSKLKTAWMNGIQFYLTRDVPCCQGHVIYADSPWAITSISQAQFWSSADLSQFGDGKVHGLLSVDISDWTMPGSKTTKKSAQQCTSAAEIANEVWAQLTAHLAATIAPISESDRDDWFLDPSIVFHAGGVTNTQPLLINVVGSWANRPDATTEIPNLFLASDYVRTNTDLATMESANEAARRAANGILSASGSSAEKSRVWEFTEPPVFQPLKDIDRMLFRLGLPHPGFDRLREIFEAKERGEQLIR